MTVHRIDGHKLLNFASHIDDTAVEQAKETAAMPFVHPHVALMPDAHTGKGSAVGTVIPTIDAVIPAAVGVDIGCGMIVARTTFSADDLACRDMSALREAIEAAIPLSPGNYNHDLDRFPFTAARIEELQNLAWPGDDGEDQTRFNVDLSHSPKWRQQLGSLGGGNHFIELCLDEAERVWLFLHSGSRGVGNKIAQKHIKVAQKLCKRWWIDLPNPDLAYLPQGTPEFAAYLRELNWAQRFAMENRAEMMDRFALVFAAWVGAPQDEVAAFIETTVNTHHNYTAKEKHGGRDVWLTRKGAIDAHEGRLGIIPGSMGTRSYIVRGKGNPAGLCSAPHGAGRRFSRAEARRRFTADDLAERMRGIEYRHGDEWVDEIPDAYKDIDSVMADAEDLVEVVHELRQVLNVKGT
jgi:tRNA-splicing ligase RtcB